MKRFSWLVSFLLFFPLHSFADDLIQGHYCYTYGDNESLKEARELTRSLAIRNAIESYRAFIISASAVKNFQLTNDLVQIITSGYLKDIKVVEYKEDGRTICEKIQASVSPQAVESAIKKEVVVLQRRFDFEVPGHCESFFSMRFISNIIAARMIFDEFDGSPQRQRAQREHC